MGLEDVSEIKSQLELIREKYHEGLPNWQIHFSMLRFNLVLDCDKEALVKSIETLHSSFGIILDISCNLATHLEQVLGEQNAIH